MELVAGPNNRIVFLDPADKGLFETDQIPTSSHFDTMSTLPRTVNVVLSAKSRNNQTRRCGHFDPHLPLPKSPLRSSNRFCRQGHQLRYLRRPSASSHSTPTSKNSSPKRIIYPSLDTTQKSKFRHTRIQSAPTEARSFESCNLDSFPNCQFFKIEAIFRPWRLEAVVKALHKGGVRGMTATSVSGVGSQSGNLERYAGKEFSSDVLIEKTRLDVVASREQVDDIIDIMVKAARTGEVGDGKIFVHPIADVIRIRTGEAGALAERMLGGRSDILGPRNES